MTTTRTHGAIATILDNNALLEAGRRRFALQYPGEDPQLLSHGFTPNMLLPVNHGERAIVNSEGVGAIADEHEIVDVYFTYAHYTVIKVALTLDEIAAASTEETIDLAHGIRTFGDRLDTNHWRWYSRYDHNA